MPDKPFIPGDDAVAPAITGGALLAAINSIALFGPQAFLGLPAQIVYIPTRIYGALGAYPPRFADASALSIVLVLVTVIGLAVQRRYLGRRSFVTVSGRGARPARSGRATDPCASTDPCQWRPGSSFAALVRPP